MTGALPDPKCEVCGVALRPDDCPRHCAACIEWFWISIRVELVFREAARQTLLRLLRRRLGDVLEDAYQTGAFL